MAMTKPRDNLRSGFTTGACAAAASRGALLALLEQKVHAEAAVVLPFGRKVVFPLHSCTFSGDEGRASVIKDAGDDPDVTDRAEICARVWFVPIAGIQFQGGPGVGVVTRKGLPVPPGEPAINPGPRKLIAETLAEILVGRSSPLSGLVVEISVPGGEEMAKKTFNPRLGIVGGISILGTTGIVVPYSTSAWVASVIQEIDVARAAGQDRLILTVGERGERLARKLFSGPAEVFIQMGPFFGAALRHCLKTGTRKVLLAAMIGKLAKFAAGNESVHSTSSRQDFTFLADLGRQSGASPEVVGTMERANTAPEVADLAREAGLDDFFPLLCRRAWTFARSLVQDGLEVEVFLLGSGQSVLARFPP